MRNITIGINSTVSTVMEETVAMVPIAISDGCIRIPVTVSVSLMSGKFLKLLCKFVVVVLLFVFSIVLFDIIPFTG